MRTLLILGFVFSFVPSLSAQTTQDNPPNPKGKKAYSIPVSKRNVQFQVTTPAGEPFTLLVQEGGMAKVLDYKDGYAYALVPILKGIDGKSCDIAAYRLTQDKDGNESIQELEHVTPNFDEAVSTQAEPKLKIKLVPIDSDSASDAARSSTPTNKEIALAFGTHRDCCVTCGNVTACANGVCASCGQCNDPARQSPTAHLENRNALETTRKHVECSVRYSRVVDIRPSSHE